MAFQVRLRHAVGERVVELPERGVSQPLIIGRGREADLQVPSAVVMPQHCVMFVHEGQWIIQPTGGEISLNGGQLAEPAVLQIGDKIRLGSGPGSPTLEIDPVGAADGKSGPVAAMPASQPPPAAARPMSPSRSGPAPAPAPDPRRNQNKPPPMPAYSGPTTEMGASQQESGGDISEFDWAAANSAAASDPKSKLAPRRKTTNSVVPMIVTIVIGSGLIIGVAWFVVHHLNQPAPKPIVIEERIGSPSTAPAGPVKLFDLNADQNAARKVHAPDGGGSEQQAQPPNGTPDTGSGGSSSAPRNGATMAHVQAAGQPLTNATVASAQVDATADAPESAAPAAVDANDPAWQDVESAHFNVRRQGMAIVRYDEYRRNNPGKNTALLDKYQDEAVNWLYWQRIAQLWTKQDDLGAQIKQKDMDLRNQPSGEFHDQLAKDRAELQTKLDSARREMTDDMGYTADVPPDIQNPGKIAALSQHRNADKFGKFQRRVLKYARDNHGSVWWDGE